MHITHTPRSGITGSWDSSIFVFKRRPPYCFPQCLRQSATPTSCVYEFFSPSSLVLVICGVFDSVTGDVVIDTVVLIFVSLMITDVEHLVICLLAIFLHFLCGKMSIRFFCPFLSGLLFCLFLMLSCMSYLYKLDINPLSVLSFANLSSHSVGCLFIFINSFLAA